MARVLLFLVVLALTIYAVVDVAQSDRYRVRNMPRWMWTIIVIFLPVVGPILWLAFGRPAAKVERKSGPISPDDDPDFLRRMGE